VWFKCWKGGKIVDIIHPLGTYAMYKVQIFNDGKILTLAKHGLVKGLPDDLVMFNSDMHSQFIIQKQAIQVKTSSLNLHILIVCLKLQS
jgi:hypothetical protein